MNAPKGRPHRRCIFCDGINVSKEHFYPEWMAPLLPGVTSKGHAWQVITNHPIEGRKFGPEVQKPVPLTTKKIRAPCGSCNSSWMNRIESAARPFLTEMISGSQVTLDAPDQLAVARWIALKIMVSEYNQRDNAVTPAHDRENLRGKGLIPKYYRIYIGAHSASIDAGQMTSSSTGSLPGQPVPPMFGMAKNVLQSSFLAGRLVVHVNASRIDGFNIEDRIKIPAVHEEMRIWPLVRTRFHWPAGPTLTDADLAFLFSSWSRALAGEGIVWGGDNIPPAGTIA